MSEKTRRVSTMEDFMSYNTDDLLYGAMQYLSTFHPVEEEIYLTKKNFNKYRRELYSLCNLNAQSLKRHLAKLEERGLIREEKMKVGADEVEVYTFPYDYDGTYEIVEREMLWYVVSTRNQQAVRVYIHLLSCYKWKQKENDNYLFTNKDILRAMGYSTNSNNALASSMVSNILESFSREGVIEFEEFYEEKVKDDGNIVPTPRKRLLFVAKSKSEIK